ncbi:MAG: DUF4037 domain-containing protein [Anaerolineae bacterium]|nr:DUF4037 domain-containing protein [Anaerolineae bacterium]
MPEFIPGLELSRAFFAELVQPVLEAEFPDLRYDAALIDSGSEVLGFDTPLSRDHHWGPRVSLYVSEEELTGAADAIGEVFRQRLPYTFRGYPTSFEEIPDEPGILRFEPKTSGPVQHRIEVTTVGRFVRGYLGYAWQPGRIPEPPDWLTFPQQKLRTLTAGGVFHAGLGEVPALRQQFAWYPRDVWLYLLAAGWTRIGQEEPFVGRTGDVGDELGSRILAARLVRDLMQLGFLMERQYAPYAKWFGTAFARLACSPRLSPILNAALDSEDWHERERHLAAAYGVVADLHNALGLTDPLPAEVSSFHERPYQVIHGERFAEALMNQVQDEAVRRLAAGRMIGAIDQFSDSTDLREAAWLRGRIRALYE